MSPQTAATLDQPALLSIDGPVATITLNRPDAFNSINTPIAKCLEELAAQITKDDSIRVVVIEGSGRAFCGGGDIQVFGANMDNLAPVVSELLHHLHHFIAAIRRMPKIVISSVHGSAAGAGLSLAFIADMCIAANDAKFTPAYNKLGVSPDGGGTIGVTEAVGSRRALQIFLAEDSFTAQQAYDWGLVVKLVPPDQLKQATNELAQRLAKNSPDVIRTTKALIHAATRTPIEQQLEAEAAGITHCMTTAAFRGAVEKFLGKKR